MYNVIDYIKKDLSYLYNVFMSFDLDISKNEYSNFEDYVSFDFEPTGSYSVNLDINSFTHS